MSLASGTRLGSYEIVSKLGDGGMGEVYRGTDTRLGREVAIKVLAAATASSPDALARFEREGRAIAALNHPNICTLHDVGTDDGRPYLVMELLAGATLHQVLASGPLSVGALIDHAIALADALQAAHTRGIIHRDLKHRRACERICLTSWTTFSSRRSRRIAITRFTRVSDVVMVKGLK